MPERDEGAGATVLIVDDDPDVCDTIAELLADAGYWPVVKLNGGEAIAYLRAAAPPALILLDVMMPGMDGSAFRREQARDPALAAIPTVLLTASPDVVEQAEFAGVAGSLRKPVRLGELLSTIARLMAGRPTWPI
jgi:CheY-like chemotaxis protein